MRISFKQKSMEYYNPFLKCEFQKPSWGSFFIEIAILNGKLKLQIQGKNIYYLPPVVKIISFAEVP